MYTEHNRALSYAIAASIVLHAVLLFGISQRDRPRSAEAPLPSILARLVESPVAAPAAAPAAQSAPVTPPPRAKPAAPKRLARPAPTPTPQPAAEPAVEEAPVAEARTESRVGDAPATGAAPAAAAAGAPPAEPTLDPGSLERYRMELKLVATKYKRYPRTATDRNWKGVVALRMVVAPSGQVASLTVTKTSGHDVLDRQAQEMFTKAAADVPIPPVLRGKQFAFDVAVDYYLTD